MENEIKKYDVVKMQVLGGEIHNKSLTSTLTEQEFWRMKGIIWAMMISQMMMPVRWHKANKLGTRIKFQTIRTPEDLTQAVRHFNVYCDTANNFLAGNKASHIIIDDPENSM